MKSLKAYISEANSALSDFGNSIIKVRLAELNDRDELIKIHWTSPEFRRQPITGKDAQKYIHDILVDKIRPRHKFDFSDYDNLPNLEIQGLPLTSEEWEDWVFIADPVELYHNL